MSDEQQGRTNLNISGKISRSKYTVMGNSDGKEIATFNFFLFLKNLKITEMQNFCTQLLYMLMN